MTNELKRYFSLLEERPTEFIQNDKLRIITDEKTIDSYCKQHNNVKIGVVYESKYHIMIVDLVQDKNGNVFPYERILNSVPGGTVMLTMHNGKFVLLNQFRHALRNKQYAFPRGFKEFGISSLENAEKEINEEIHIHDKKADISYKFLGKVVADSGLSGNHVDIFLVSIKDNKEELYANDTEGIICSVEVTEKEFVEMIRSGEITDGFSLSAYSIWKFDEVPK